MLQALICCSHSYGAVIPVLQSFICCSHSYICMTATYEWMTATYEWLQHRNDWTYAFLHMNVIWMIFAWNQSLQSLQHRRECCSHSNIQYNVVVSRHCNIEENVAVTQHSFISHYPCVAVCCSVLQCVAVTWIMHTAAHCNTLLHVAVTRDSFVSHYPCVAVCCSVLQCVAVCCSVLQCVAVCCSVLQCVAVCCSVLQCVAVCCCVLQYVAVCCSVLQLFSCVCCSDAKLIHITFSIGNIQTSWNLPNRETQFPRYKFKWNHNLRLNLYREIPSKLSFQIWWILKMKHFQWKLSYWECHGVRYYKIVLSATHCNTLQHTATHCNTLQHTATLQDWPRSLSVAVCSSVL